MKKAILILSCIMIVLMSGCSEDTAPKKVSSSEAKNTIVYITKTGECYHKSNCSTLRKTKIEKTLSQVAQKYRACQLCNPPTIEQR